MNSRRTRFSAFASLLPRDSRAGNHCAAHVFLERRAEVELAAFLRAGQRRRSFIPAAFPIGNCSKFFLRFGSRLFERPLADRSEGFALQGSARLLLNKEYFFAARLDAEPERANVRIVVDNGFFAWEAATLRCRALVNRKRLASLIFSFLPAVQFRPEGRFRAVPVQSVLYSRVNNRSCSVNCMARS